ncbi:COMM domain-containing protein 6 [Notolabrus celidotus]|uniref:COMM domain-containing protein 6 n=1 Tax=Notolabrus celidotus TaxID=1203425 RepID=UPI00148FBF17|nr:COMM domain-containing protein 6 [Notolabrus celidotus]
MHQKLFANQQQKSKKKKKKKSEISARVELSALDKALFDRGYFLNVTFISTLSKFRRGSVSIGISASLRTTYSLTEKMPAAEESHGVNKVVDDICTLTPDLLAEACQHILAYLQGHTRGVDSAEISDRFQRAGVRLEHEALQSMIRYLLLTFRSAGKSNLSGDDLVLKLEESSNKWPKASLQVVHRLWSEHGTSVHAQQELHAVLSISQLVDMQWKLGMAVSSDTCRSLNSPYVSLLLKIVEPSGQISHRSFEMTIPQFQNFHKQFKEMAAVMETV